MQLAVNTTRSLRPVAAARRATQVTRPSAVHSARSQRRVLMVVRATEESTATAEAGASDAQQAAEPVISPLERARAVLAADDAQQAALEAALSDIDAELARLGDAASAAESRVAVLEGTIATAKDQLLRLNADFDNFRRRSQNEKDSLAASVRSDMVQDLLPLIDNFELARTQVKVETEGEQRINNSYQGLYKQMVEIMRGLGIEAVPTTGTPFDPEIHEAIMREPDETVADGTVLQEFRKGFRMGDKLIRPAMVKVSVNEGGVVTPPQEE